jgi:hypothetical protein
MNDLTIEQLAQQLVAAKAAENAANKQRVAIEEKIIELVGAREEGSATTELANGLKLTITGKMTYKADMPTLLTICQSLPEAMRPIKTEVKLDETGAKWLRNNEPETWAQIAPAITITPAKTSVSVKV